MKRDKTLSEFRTASIEGAVFYLTYLTLDHHKYHNKIRYGKGRLQMDGKDKGSRPEYTGEPHEMNLLDRKRLAMSGVKEVVAFNERQIQVETVHGPCMVEGEDLNIQQLNLENGKLVVDGLVTSISYNVRGQKNFMNRIFK